MFNYQQYKKNALSQLKNRWKPAILVSLVVIAFFAVKSIESKKNSMNLDFFSTMFSVIFFCIIGILNIAQCYYYLKASRTNEKMRFSDFTLAIAEYWQDGILSAFLRAFWIFMWSFLFIIPGFIKMIEYSQINFVIIENPGISLKKALQISKILTKGHRADLLTMYFSFAGWMILAAIPFGAGFILLLPYINQTKANAYTALKEEALRIGKLLPADFMPAEIA